MHYIIPEVTKTDIFNSFGKTILIQPIDGTAIQPWIAESMNQFDLIITASGAAKKILENSGVKSQIAVIPYYYKPEDIKPVSDYYFRNIPNDKFIFFSDFYLRERKNPDKIYKSYIDAFSNEQYYDKVCLVLKTSPLEFHKKSHINEFKRKIKEYQEQFKYKPEIILINQKLSNKMLGGLYHKMDAYINLSGIEGFCIPMLKSSVLGKKIIALENNYSGYNDFLKNPKLISSKFAPDDSADVTIYSDISVMASPSNWDELIKVLRDTVDEGKNSKKISEKTGSLEFTDYLYENVMKQYNNYLN